MFVAAASAENALGFGLLVAAFWFGVRHGIDWDHIAAITDVTGSQEDRRQAILLGTLYALGHALVVLALGILAIVIGERLPEGVDEFLTRVVGVTLIVLGIYVVVSLVRHGRDFRLRSRWMLVFAGVRKGVRWAKQRASAGDHREQGSLELQHRVGADEGDELSASLWHHGHHGRPGHHHHSAPELEEEFPSYGRRTAFGVGMIHGIGAETPTQVLIFLSAASAGGSTASGGRVVGLLVLLSFVVGLLASNSVITVGSAFGFLRATKNFAIYATVAVLTAVFSLAIGVIFVINRPDLLPPLFAG